MGVATNVRISEVLLVVTITCLLLTVSSRCGISVQRDASLCMLSVDGGKGASDEYLAASLM